MFSRKLYILPRLLVFANGHQTVSCRKVLWKPLWSSAEITLQILQESVQITDVFSTAVHTRCAGFVYEWTSNCSLSTNSKTFLKKLEENNKIPLETPISICVHWQHCVYKLNWPFGAWASWKRGQSPYQFPAKRRPLQKSSGGLIWRRWQRLQKISSFSAL